MIPREGLGVVLPDSSVCRAHPAGVPPAHRACRSVRRGRHCGCPVDMEQTWIDLRNIWRKTWRKIPSSSNWHNTNVIMFRAANLDWLMVKWMRFFKLTVKDLLLGKVFCWTSCSTIELFLSGFLWESDGILSLPPNMGESAHCPLNQCRNSMNYQMGTFTVQHLTTTWCSELNHTLVDLFIVEAQSGFIIRGVKSESSANCKQIANHPSYPNSRCYCPVTAF